MDHRLFCCITRNRAAFAESAAIGFEVVQAVSNRQIKILNCHLASVASSILMYRGSITDPFFNMPGHPAD